MNTRLEQAVRITLVLLLPLLGCGTSPNAPKPEEPSIPSPQMTMLIDLGIFGGSQQTAKASPDEVLTKQNFITAAAVVTAFNTAVLAGLSVPALATAAALSVKPTFEDDGKFHWKYTYDDGVFSLTLELTAKVGENTVEWEMFVTGNFERPLENFLWYDGQSDFEATAGHWQFYDPNQPDRRVQHVRIDWTVQAEDDRTLTFLNNNENSPRFGDTLTYTVKGDDVTMTFVQAATGATIEVAFNRSTREGYIIAPNYKNGEKACWDGNLEDVACAS